MSEPMSSEPLDTVDAFGAEPAPMPEDESDLPFGDPAGQSWWDDEEE
jgi:hypothetical protein